MTTFITRGGKIYWADKPGDEVKELPPEDFQAICSQANAIHSAMYSLKKITEAEAKGQKGPDEQDRAKAFIELVTEIEIARQVLSNLEKL